MLKKKKFVLMMLVNSFGSQKRVFLEGLYYSIRLLFSNFSPTSIVKLIYNLPLMLLFKNIFVMMLLSNNTVMDQNHLCMT